MPARHSLSPALHNAAFAALGIDAAYLAFEVRPRRLAEALAGAAALGAMGLSVTMPHKEAAAAWAARRSERVRRLGSANTLSFSGGEAVAESTDGAGFLASLAEAGVFLQGARLVVIGAGGAAKAVALAAAEAGASDVAVVARRPEAASKVAELVGPPARAGSLGDVGRCDVVVNATPLGMAGGAGEGRSPLPGGLLSSRQVVVDLVYHPARTPLLLQAAEAGAVGIGGEGMLLHQAAEQVRIWTGQEPPLEVMRNALNVALAGREAGKGGNRC